MKYKCGCFMYDLPNTACVFCQKCDVFYDYTGGIYMLLCSDNKPIMKNGLCFKGCDDRKPFPLGTSFDVSTDDIIAHKLTELGNYMKKKR